MVDGLEKLTSNISRYAIRKHLLSETRIWIRGSEIARLYTSVLAFSHVTLVLSPKDGEAHNNNCFTRNVVPD
jgi:hypothetical protein